MTAKPQNLPVRRTRPLPAHPRIALALGGGGARGLAHILMLEVFDELGLRPSVIAGTSIGALFGAAYAAGLSARDIRNLAEETLRSRFDLVRQLFAARAAPTQKFMRWLPVRSSLLDAGTLLDLVMPKGMPLDFERLEIPLRVVATDLGARDAVVFSTGALKPAIAASISIPVVFSPVVWQGRTLVDGGLVNPLPFDLVADDADITVAIDVSGAAAQAVVGPRPSAIDTLMQSVQILEKSITREKLRARQPDIYIDVAIDSFNALAFHRSRTILEAALPAKEALKRQLSRVLASETVDTIAPALTNETTPSPPRPKGLARFRRR